MLWVRRASWLAIAVIAGGALPAAAQPEPPALAYTGPADGAVATAVRERLARFARERGIGLVDLARPAPPAPRARELLAAGIEAYHGFRYAQALASLEAAVAEVEASGAAGLERRELADLFLYRALSATETGDAEIARDNLVRAAVIHPGYPIDKARFRPSLITAYERAREAVLAVAAAEVELVFPERCEVTLDGGETSAGAVHSLRPGRHLIRARCPGKRPFAASPTFAAGRQRYAPPLEAAADPRASALAETAPAPRVIWASLESGDLAIALLDRATGKTTRRWKLRLESATEVSRLDAILASVIEREFAAPAAPPVIVEKKSGSRPLVRQPWFWVAVGAVAVSAVAVPLALTRSEEPGGWGAVFDSGAFR